MTEALSLRVYGRLLALYPEELRRDFGSEMALAFAEDLAAARSGEGWRGTLRVWNCALVEMLRIAVPGQLTKPAFRAPLIGVLFSLVSMSLQLAMVEAFRPPRHVDAIAILPSFATVMIPLVVIFLCRGSRVISLGLSDDREER